MPRFKRRHTKKHRPQREEKGKAFTGFFIGILFLCISEPAKEISKHPTPKRDVPPLHISTDQDMTQ